jgi:hypothetical protein
VACAAQRSAVRLKAGWQRRAELAESEEARRLREEQEAARRAQEELEAKLSAF